LTRSGGSLKPDQTARRDVSVAERLVASLGKGRVAKNGWLQCPRHAALYDVVTGKMVRGPQGAFKPLAGALKETAGARSLKAFPVEVCDGAICLVG
jgi:nitrite reductase/ring-hydroxylating ferredoxin subunit